MRVRAWLVVLLTACSSGSGGVKGPARRPLASLSSTASAQDHASSPATLAAAARGGPGAGASLAGERAPASDADAREAPRPGAAESEAQVQRLLALPGRVSTSLGGPAGGRVRGAVALPDSGPGFVHNPRRPYEARFGTIEMVQALMRAAAIVAGEYEASTLTINDLGLVEGGPIAQHGSHQAGRDVDVLFYLLDAGSGKPVPSVGAPLDPKGIGWDFKDLAIAADDQKVRIDAKRTWRFFQALLEVAGEQVQRVYIVEHLRTLLLAEAERVRAPASLRARFADLTCQPGPPHDDHAHVRFYCTPEDMAEGCFDSAPIYPWRAGALNALGLAPALAPVGRTPEQRAERAARTTSAAEARTKAGPMHAKVKRFLAERESWMKQPRTGRTYCR